MKSLLGVNVNVAPLERQDPAGTGTRIGAGELFDSGAEKLTTIGAFAAMSSAPLAGVMRATLSAAGGALVVVELVLEGALVPG